jgi:polysaccharide deacetylase 2 family uncharacterized protein YibQ
MFGRLTKRVAPGRASGSTRSDPADLLPDNPFADTIKQDLGAFDSAVARPPKRKSRLRGFLFGVGALIVSLGGVGAAAYYLPVERWVGEYLFVIADRVARIADGDIRASGPIPPSRDQRPTGLMQPPGESGTETSLSRRPWLAEAGNTPTSPPPAAVPPPPQPPAPAKPTPNAAPSVPKPANGTAPATPPPAPLSATPAPQQMAVAKAPAVDPPRPIPQDSAEAVTFAKLPPWKGERKALRTEPLKALHLRTDRGTLPIVANGRQAWKAYARPFENPGNKPKVAVLVTGLGLAKEATDAAIAGLPPEISLAFSPYAANLSGLVTRSWGAGHEVLLNLPGETDRFPNADPGPLGILTGISIEENIERLERVLGKAPGAFGVTAYGTQGVPTFQSAKHLEPLFRVLKDRGMAYVGPGGRSGVAAADAFTIADERLFKASIDARLAQAMEAARKNGQALVVVGARAASFDRLLAWSQGLEQAGVVLAPVSALVKVQGN